MDQEESKIYLNILVFCALLAILIAGFIVSFFRQQKRMNTDKIKAQINTSEEIKKRFATDLHDDLGPILATIKIYVNALSQNKNEDPKLLQNLNNYIDLGITRVKAIANDLMPNTLQRKNLLTALEEYIGNIRVYVTFAIDFQFDSFDCELQNDAKLNIYRVIQEIITNTIKYADATLLKIRVEKKEQHLLIATADDGIGFSYTDHNFTSSGYGISNIKSRVEIMEGACTIYSKPGEGTRYQISIPLKKICR